MITSRLKIFLVILAFSVFVMTWPASTFAAGGSQIVLVLDGIRGESTTYKDGITIYSMSFGASNPGASSSSGKAGKTTYSDFSFMKSVDTATLPLLKSLSTGKKINNGTLYFFNNSNQPYLVIQLKDIQITSDQLSGSNAEKLTESVSLNAAELKFEYTPTGKSGKPGPKQTLDIDIANQTAK